MSTRCIFGSLGHIVETCPGSWRQDQALKDDILKRIPDFFADTVKQGFARSFMFWNTLNSLACDVSGRRNVFGVTLSTAQWNSFRLSKEWILMHHSAIDPRSGILDSTHVERPSALLAAVDVHLFHVMDRKEEKDFRSSHDYALSSLFEHEFVGHKYDYDTVDPRRLVAKRQEAAVEAACFRIAIPCFVSALRESGNAETAFESGILHVLSRTRTHEESPLGASNEPCPWLLSKEGQPFYLWDRTEQRTVEVSTLPPNPQYTAISHTWGRWQKSTPPVRVNGVDGWLVPENEIFQVLELPNTLEKFPTITRYIWFDLLCIPQDRSVRALQEIARQAIIFRGALCTIAWLNKITDWTGLKGMLEWTALQYMYYELEDDLWRAETRFSTAYQKATLPTGLFEPYQYGPSITRQQMEPSGWFTSLWTLQEACLRPDMLLCNSNWELLTAGDLVPVTLDSLIALTGNIVGQGLSETVMDPGSDEARQFDSVFHEVSPGEKLRNLIDGRRYPRGFLELFELLERTGMDNLHIIRREAITALGAQRYCKESRAEAIMSVVGATNWWETALQRPMMHSTDNLVLGLYPFPFAIETARKVGASFFNAVLIRASGSDELTQTPAIRGSLLPFCSSVVPRIEEKFIAGWGFQEDDHPSVMTWSLQIDGSVKIPEAGILTCTGDHEDAGLMCEIALAYKSDSSIQNMRERFQRDARPDDRLKVINLREWANDWLPFSKNFAVVLTRSEIMGRNCIRGVLLKEVGPISGVMVKVGIFTTARWNAAANFNERKAAQYLVSFNKPTCINYS